MKGVAERRDRRPARGDAIVALGLLAVAVYTLWPAWRQFGAVIPGDPTSDAYDHLWGYWWWSWALTHGLNPLHDTLSHQPAGGALWFVDPLNALLCAPIQMLVSTAGATTLVLTGQVWATLLAVWLGLRREAPFGAPVAAITVGAGAYVLGLLQSGVYEFVAIGPLAAFYLALRTGGPAWACGALWCLAGLSNFYHAAFAGLLALVVLVEGRADVRRVATSALAALPGLGVLSVVAWSTLSAADAVIRPETAPSWTQGNFPAVDPEAFVRWGNWYFPDNARMGNFGIVHIAYIGWVAIALGALGLWRAETGRRRGVLLSLVCALGPALAWAQEPVRLAGHDVWLPLALLYFPGSPVKFVHHPYRLVVVLLIALAPSVAAGVERLTGAVPSRVRVGLSSALAALFLAEVHGISPAAAMAASPRRATVAPVVADAFSEAAATDPRVTGVLNFPPDAHTANRRYEMLAIFHHKQVPYGVNSFLPDAWATNGLIVALMGCLDDPQRHGVPRDGGPPPRLWFSRGALALPTPDAAAILAGANALRHEGYSHLVVDPGLRQEEQARIRALVSQISVVASEENARSGDGTVYELPEEAKGPR